MIQLLQANVGTQKGQPRHLGMHVSSRDEVLEPFHIQDWLVPFLSTKVVVGSGMHGIQA